MVPDRINIIYFTDPLCCWSWAMEPQWRKLIFQYKDYLNWSYCMGGLIPSWDGFVDNVNSVSRAGQMGPMWLHAEQISGMPMCATIWKDNPPASSFPACIAVACATSQSLQCGELLLRKLRESCHLNNQDIADTLVIFNVAEALAMELSSFDLVKFRSDFESKTGQELFRTDWEDTRRREVARFPTLFLTKQQVGTIQLSGYRSFATLKSALFQLEPSLQELEVNVNLDDYRNFWGTLLPCEEKEFTTERVASLAL
ncbi:MAG: DsbA family protein [Cyclobacteriaceae bacterium]|nr:DsbA family protein [Cyclobacteriaceae bacterium]